MLGEYVLLGTIGAGGMGQVFKAKHRRMDRLVATKLLPPERTKDQAAIKRLEREVRAAAKLSHPNIVVAHDAGQAKDQVTQGYSREKRTSRYQKGLARNAGFNSA